MTESMIPDIRMHGNAFKDSFTVELGGQVFTEAQWTVVSKFVEQRVAAGGHGHKAQAQNAEFHKAMGIETAATPRAIPAADVPVVIELIREEFIDELIPALGAYGQWMPDGTFQITHYGTPNVVEIYDAALDILYVTYGLLNRAGMDAEPGYDEVQASNMSKLGADGLPIIAGPNDPDGVFPGRVKKGPNYFKPNLVDVLRAQGYQPQAHPAEYLPVDEKG